MSHSSSEEGSAENPEQHDEAKDQEDHPAEEQEGKAEEDHPAEDQAETVTVHIGNLKWEVTEDDLRDLFNEFGEIKSVRIPQDDRHRSRGFGFVEFATKEAADAAIEKMNQYDLKGRNINVSIANPGQRNNNYEDRDRRGGRGGRDNRRDDRHRYDRDRDDRRRDHDRRDRDRGDRGDRYNRGRQY
ncbi:hypothetical protein M9Y10_045854 [Tritrichomonas musculus]|uniref:RRM domain-containing protein n=1 Tax=Tritrichomonas musculus TaxID=1915356 RepID=A0ABR2JXH9_9EUKA